MIAHLILCQTVSLKILNYGHAFGHINDYFLSDLLTLDGVKNLEQLEICLNNKLTIEAVSIALEKCPKIVKIGCLSQWGGVNRGQIEIMNHEIQVRNIQLEIY